MAQKIITISLPEELLGKLDQAIIEEFCTRSQFVRQAIIDQLQTIDGYRRKLTELASKVDGPTHDELLETLRHERARRWYINRDG
jgi:Arc/MetJ-type ribon-helix-helix transcriptional regulator